MDGIIDSYQWDFDGDNLFDFHEKTEGKISQEYKAAHADPQEGYPPLTVSFDAAGPLTAQLFNTNGILAGNIYGSLIPAISIKLVERINRIYKIFFKSRAILLILSKIRRGQIYFFRYALSVVKRISMKQKQKLSKMSFLLLIKEQKNT